MRSAVILAGGNSRRLGVEKALLVFDEKPLIVWTVERLGKVADEVVVVARDAGHAGRLEKIVSGISDELDISTLFTWDSVSGYGPVAGLDAGMRRGRGIFAFATGCDLPFLEPRVIERLFVLAEEGGFYDATVPVQANEFFEPLHSVYRLENMGRACRRAMERGERRIHAPLQELSVNCISMDRLRPLDMELLSFFNLNTKEDLQRARALWQTRWQKHI